MAMALCLAAGSAWAFYPVGGTNQQGQLVFPTWPLTYMDRNHDGDVSGPDEGVKITFETGELGFTSAEMAKIQDGAEVWERVPTAYIAWTFGQTLPNPPDTLETSRDIGSLDAFNYCAIQTGDETQATEEGGAWIFTTAIVENTSVTLNGQTVNLTGPAILDVDVVFVGAAIRPLVTGEQAAMELAPLSVIAYGLGAGLWYSPLYNFEEGQNQVDTRNVESRVVWLPDRTGVLEKVGVTPSMLNLLFYYDDGAGIYTDARYDLAPDDIAGISFLYPRGNQDKFFTLAQEARTTAPRNVPSVPLVGAHIVAWCDTDNNPGTARVPFLDTLTGLFVASENYGKFELKNLFKTLSTEGGELFNASYTITMAKFDYPFENVDSFDSTHSLGGGITPTEGDFPSYTFRDGENLLSVDRHDQGTPLMFDPIRRKIVSATTARTLEVMLPQNTPMFGSDDICFFSKATVGLPSDVIPRSLRAFRDQVLVHTAAGTALATAYYQVSPVAVRFLEAHPLALEAVRTAARGAYWGITHPRTTIASMLAVIVAFMFVAVRRLRRRTRLQAASAALLLAFLCMPTSANALLLPMTPDEAVAKSTNIVVATVRTVESRWEEPANKIVTDVTLDVSETIKGTANKGGLIRLTLPGGQVGAVVTKVSNMPTFKEREEVLVFLRETKKGPEVVGAARGKLNIETDLFTGKKSVVARSFPAGELLTAIANAKSVNTKTSRTDEALPEAAAPSIQTPVVPLDDVKNYLQESALGLKH